MEHWIEINLFANRTAEDEILLDVLNPFVEQLRRKRVLVSWHFFREPEIRFRVRLRSRRAKLEATRRVEVLAGKLLKRNLISSWHFGNHGEKTGIYMGEEDRYGRYGWRVAQVYFQNGAEVALRLLALKRAGRLENPLWARGLGNPWEGGGKNPWRSRRRNPLVYHWSRYVHLFTNQLGFDLDDEVRLCSRQASRYRKVMKQIGMRW
jgi:hypothetical protein